MIKQWLILHKHKIRVLLMMMLMSVVILSVQLQQDHVLPLDITFADNKSSLSSLSKGLSTSLADHKPINYHITSSPTIELLSSTKNEAKISLPPKTVYLTFDDGPSKLTGKVLDILKESNIKGTFFVLGEQVHRYPEFITRITEEGHALGNHTYNHNYEELYKGFSPFWNQIKQTEDEISLITGFRPSLVRAPGGTAGHFDDTYFTLLKQGGYQVVDWNVDSGDSKRRGVPAQEIIKGATTDIHSDQIIVLMHDGSGHEETVKALPEIITYYRDKGYKFDILTPELEPVQFKITESARALKRQQPSQEWTATNVAPNSTLFSKGKRLVMEIGRMETDFKYGEYRLTEGRIMVPLRATMEKLGVKVEWDGENKLVRMNMGMESIQMNVVTGQWISNNRIMNQVERTMNVPVQLSGDTLWVPLRELLQASGYAQIAVSMNKVEWRVTTIDK
ncbi:polysaccharide deacetylase [Paenibacillus sp. FA6]|uniref:polysaccharide deacetylase n=1 Tax=Paenibacillus sp. FA6 TaxID=3413029 RepID=UPI003F65FFC4